MRISDAFLNGSSAIFRNSSIKKEISAYIHLEKYKKCGRIDETVFLT